MRLTQKGKPMTENAPPGWYQSETDPPGTERYWDGSQWSAETRAVMAPPPAAAGARMTPHDRELASPGARVGARLIDSFLLAAIFVPLLLRDLDLDGAAFGATALPGSRVLLGAVIGAAYEIGFTALKSATPGKMVVGLEIVRKADGQAPVGFTTAGLRWLPFGIGYVPAVSNLSSLVVLASLVMVFVDDFRRSVYDLVGQTYVVRKPRAR